MKRFRWTIRDSDDEACERLSREINVSLPIARALCNRGICDFDQAKAFFRPDPAVIPSPFLFRDMQCAVERVMKALEQGEHILLYGDYDVDGTTGTALLMLFLRSQGAEVSYYINDRFTEGYGLSDAGVGCAVERGAGLVITVDCGIRAVKEVEAFNVQGIDVIVCDHHEPGTLPAASAILNPKVPGCSYPFRELCGCGVAFKLVQALIEQMGRDAAEWEQYLDLVAVATLADMVALKEENRIYMHQGLQRLKAAPRMSIQELISCMGARLESLSAGVIAFGIAPRINAAGRMQNAATAVEWLMSDSRDECRKHAEELDRLNGERREIDAGILKLAEGMVNGYFASYCSSLVLYHEDWHLGVLGIVASRLQEKYYLPTVVLGGSDGLIKGSVRSVGGLNVMEVLQECSGLLEKFGGHEAAAGVTLKPENLQRFRKRFDALSAERLSYEQRQKEVIIDTQLQLDEVSPKFINVLSQFAPFGFGNPEPVFLSRGLRISGYPRLLKGRHVKFSVKTGSGRIFDVIGFSREDIYRALERGSKQVFSMVYTLEENEWNGRKTIQMKLKDMAVEKSQ